MSGRFPGRSHAYAIAAYIVLAVAFTWPLATHLRTHLTGTPGGDTGVYVWNQWVFHEELVEHRRLPYFTDRIFSLSARRANLSLHNYTTFQNLLALPLIRPLGVVATFNVIYLLMTVLTAYAAFMLAWSVTGGAFPAWLAGAFFAWSPLMVARGTAHFSLVAAAPLAVFLVLLLRAAERERVRDAAALGLCVWWAASTDVYYAVYCVMIAAAYLAVQMVSFTKAAGVVLSRGRRWALDAVIVSIAGLVVSIAISRGWRFTFLGQTVRMHSLYTPVLVLTCLLAARVAWRWRVHVARVERRHVLYALRAASVAVVVATAMLSPVLYALGERIASAGFERSRMFWRSSPPGTDLLALVLPNPNHPLTPDVVSYWLARRPDGFIESVASVSVVALAVILLAWRAGWRPSRMWVWLTVGFGLLSLGPFVHIAGINTHVPTPWALLRYVPVVGLARMPQRLGVVFTLGLAVLLASAVYWLGERWPQRRRALHITVAAALLFELLPAPRPLYSASIPAFYAQVAAAPDDVRVLHLPFGIRDGTGVRGNFSARSQFYQTAHGKPMIGGYLSRVSRRRRAELAANPTLAGLMTLSEGKSLSAAAQAHLLDDGARFIARARVGFVVIDHTAAPAALIDVAMRAFSLRQVGEDGTFALYRPGAQLY